jgi:hypothetical protein
MSCPLIRDLILACRVADIHDIMVQFMPIVNLPRAPKQALRDQLCEFAQEPGNHNRVVFAVLEKFAVAFLRDWYKSHHNLLLPKGHRQVLHEFVARMDEMPSESLPRHAIPLSCAHAVHRRHESSPLAHARTRAWTSP